MHLWMFTLISSILATTRNRYHRIPMCSTQFPWNKHALDESVVITHKLLLEVMIHNIIFQYYNLKNAWEENINTSTSGSRSTSSDTKSSATGYSIFKTTNQKSLFKSSVGILLLDLIQLDTRWCNWVKKTKGPALYKQDRACGSLFAK